MTKQQLKSLSLSAIITLLIIGASNLTQAQTQPTADISQPTINATRTIPESTTAPTKQPTITSQTATTNPTTPSQNLLPQSPTAQPTQQPTVNAILSQQTTPSPTITTITPNVTTLSATTQLSPTESVNISPTQNPIVSPLLTTPSASITPNTTTSANLNTTASATLTTPNITQQKEPTPSLKSAWNQLSSLSTNTKNNTGSIKKKPKIKKIKPRKNDKIYLFPFGDSFRYPPPPKRQYPDLDVNGFYEAKLSGRDFSPSLADLSATDNRFEIIRKDPIYNKMPNDVLPGDPKLEMRYNISIDGQLDKDLSVHYDIEEEPDFPGRYDIQVKRKQDELTFYHFDANFENGEFINVNKALNGAKYEHKGDNLQVIATLGKERSKPKKFETFGNGQDTISIGNKYVLRGSVKVWINNNRQAEGGDYTVDYFNGTIKFNRPIDRSELIEVIYEFTNPVEDFIPVLNRKNFMGFQATWKSTPIIRTEKMTVTSKESFTITAETASSSNSLFELKNKHILLGSDSVKINDYILTKNKDYFIKHHQGKLIIKKPLYEKDVVTIDYSFYATEQSYEKIIAQNSPGPYKLKYDNIIDNSAVVQVNNRVLIENRDFVIDYDAGELFFSYPIPYPDIIDVRYTAVKIKTQTKAEQKSPISVGVTYLNESVNSEEEDLIITITSENVTATTNTIRLANTPLINLEEIAIEIDGQRLATSQYTIKNTYTSEIEISEAVASINSLSTKTVITSYKYQKSFSANKQIQSTGLKKYIVPNHFTLDNVPVKFNGFRNIRFFNGFTEQLLREGIEFIIEYNENDPVEENRGVNITIEFITNSENTQSFLTEIPPSGALLTLTYDYSPSTPPNTGDINQTMIGITVGAQINKNWSVNAEVAAAQNNFSRPQISNEDTLTGTGDSNTSYTLTKTNLVEDSESVFISNDTQNNVRLTKDRDYIINYLTGRLTFINLTPGEEDRIRVLYDFFDTSESVTSGQNEDFKLATKVDTEYKTDNLTLKADLKFIDKDFLPISPINEQKGTQAYGGSIDWKVTDEDSIFLDYHRRDINKGTKDDGSDLFLHEDDLKAESKIKMFSAIDAKYTTTYLKQVQDPRGVTGSNTLHDIDYKAYTFSQEYNFGPERFKSRFYNSQSTGINDFIDQGANHSIAKANTTEADTTLTFSKVPYLGDTVIIPGYSINETNTKARDNSIGGDNFKTTVTSREGKQLDVTLKPFKSTSIHYNVNQTQVETVVNNTTRNVNILLNELYELNFTPYAWLNTRATLSHKEDESPLANQTGLKEDRINYNISKFAPFGFLKELGASTDHWLVKPLNKSYMTFNAGDYRTENNNGKNVTKQDNYSLTYQNFRPIKGLTINRVSLEERDSKTDNLLENLTVSRNILNTKFKKTAGNLTIQPQYRYLKAFTYNFDFEQRKDVNTNRDIASNATQSVRVENKPYFKRIQTLTYNPGNLAFKLPFLPKINLGAFNGSINENWVENTNSTVTTLTPTSNIPTSSLRQENTIDKTYTYKATYSPFNLLPINGTYSTNDYLYSRNLSSADQGLTIKDSNNLNLSTNYSPFSFMTLNGSFANRNLTQHISPSLNASLGEIKQARIDENTDLFSSFLEQHSDTYKLSATFTPFSFLSLTGSGTLTDINEQAQISTANVSKNIFDQKILASTVTLRPFNSFTASYEYATKLTTQKGNPTETGNSGTLKLSYTPVQTTNFKISFEFNRVDTWGRDFNTIDQQGSINTISTEVVERKDYVQTGSLYVDVRIPLDNSPYVDSLVISGEGHLKQVKDFFDDEKKAAGQQERSYEISGLIIKATLNF